MKTYSIDMRNGQHYTAHSMKSALAIVRHSLGGGRIYRGAEYQTDRPGKGADREYVIALDIWTSRRDARREMSCMANAVISR